MLGFWQTIRVATRLPNGKLYAAGTVLGPIAAFAAAFLIKDQKTSSFVLMGIVLAASMCIERFSAYVKAVRMEDIERNSPQESKKPHNNKGGKKKKKKKR